jgi:hypothetical protein
VQRSIDPQRALAARMAAERLRTALDAARIAVDLALGVHDTLGAQATASQVARRQQATNQLLRESFDVLEVRARAAIWAVYLLDDALDPDSL